jgi:hypothetical protein
VRATRFVQGIQCVGNAECGANGIDRVLLPDRTEPLGKQLTCGGLDDGQTTVAAHIEDFDELGKMRVLHTGPWPKSLRLALGHCTYRDRRI